MERYDQASEHLTISLRIRQKLFRYKKGKEVKEVRILMSGLNSILKKKVAREVPKNLHIPNIIEEAEDEAERRATADQRQNNMLGKEGK